MSVTGTQRDGTTVEASERNDDAIAADAAPMEFEVLYRREYAGLVRLAYVLTGNRLVSEDLVQDAFVDAHRHWSRVGAYDRPGAWVRRAVINRSRSVLRRAAVELRARGRLRATDVAMPDLSVETRHFWTTVRALPTRQAQCIALRYVDDMPIADIAEVLGCAASTVRVHLHRARAALAIALDVEQEDP
jgi:RNA polymerase sigma-70 factor, ECF subfamily